MSSTVAGIGYSHNQSLTISQGGEICESGRVGQHYGCGAAETLIRRVFVAHRVALPKMASTFSSSRGNSIGFVS